MKQGKKIRYTTWIGIGIVVLLAALSYIAFQIALKDAISLVDVPFAKHTLYPHVQIREEDIVIKQIPSVYVEEGVLQKKSDIVGKYVDLQSKIAMGSLFYEDMIKAADQIEELPALLLKEGQLAFPLASDLIKSSGTSLSINQKVDVYVTYTNTKTKETTVGCLLKNVRIIGLKDRSGLSLQEEKAQRIPAVIVLAVQEEYVDLLKKASKIATIDVFAPHVDYTKEEESILQEDFVLMDLLRNEDV